jgi:hypothetical protein
MSVQRTLDDPLDDDLKILVVTLAALDFAKREIEEMRVLHPELDFAIENALVATQDVLSKLGNAAEARRAKQEKALGFADEAE